MQITKVGRNINKGMMLLVMDLHFKKLLWFLWLLLLLLLWALTKNRLMLLTRMRIISSNENENVKKLFVSLYNVYLSLCILNDIQ